MGVVQVMFYWERKGGISALKKNALLLLLFSLNWNYWDGAAYFSHTSPLLSSQYLRLLVS